MEQQSSLCKFGKPMREPRGGGGTLVFSYIPWLVSFFGVQNFDFQYFWGFQKNKFFWGYEDFVDIFWVITKLDYI